METGLLPAMNADQIMESAERYCAKYMARGCNPADIEEVKSEFMLAMVEAGNRAEAGKAVRAYQWSYAMNRVKKWWAGRYAEVMPADLDSLPGTVDRKHNPEEDKEAAVCASMDAGEYGATFADMLPAPTPAPDADMVKREEKQEVKRMRACLSKLPKRLALILRRRYLQGQSLEEIGKVLGVTREAIRQQEEKALAEMKRMMEAA